jgi:hypothetical protein
MTTTIGQSGHRLLPVGARVYIRSVLSDYLRGIAERGALRGLTSLAVGADQLFAEVVLSLKGELAVVVPCARYEETFSTLSQRRRYHRLIELAADVERLDYVDASEQAFFAAGRRVVERCDELVAIWDGKPARGPGGTADVVAYAQRSGRPIRIIWRPDSRRP